jgi:hypothetical protein
MTATPFILPRRLDLSKEDHNILWGVVRSIVNDQRWQVCYSEDMVWLMGALWALDLPGMALYIEEWCRKRSIDIWREVVWYGGCAKALLGHHSYTGSTMRLEVAFQTIRTFWGCRTNSLLGGCIGVRRSMAMASLFQNREYELVNSTDGIFEHVDHYRVHMNEAITVGAIACASRTRTFWSTLYEFNLISKGHKWPIVLANHNDMLWYLRNYKTDLAQRWLDGTPDYKEARRHPREVVLDV